MELGGMDDRFEGWGGEDDAFSIKVQKLVSRRGAAREAPAWHLWHPRAKSETPDLYRRNLELLKTYRQLDDEQLEKMCREQYKLLQDFSAYREVPARQA